MSCAAAAVVEGLSCGHHIYDVEAAQAGNTPCGSPQLLASGSIMYRPVTASGQPALLSKVRLCSQDVAPAQCDAMRASQARQDW